MNSLNSNQELFTLPKGLQLKEEGNDIRMLMHRESFGVMPVYGVYLMEEDVLFESYAIYLHTYRQNGTGRIIVDIKNRAPLPLISEENDDITGRNWYFFFLYRCFFMQRQYDWFVLSDKVSEAVGHLLPFLKESHMTCHGRMDEYTEAQRRVRGIRYQIREQLAKEGVMKQLVGDEVPDVLYDKFDCFLFSVFHCKYKQIGTYKREWYLDDITDLWGIQDGILTVFILHMQSEEESIHRMLWFGNRMKDIFAKEEEALFKNRIVNPNPPTVWHGWEEAKKVKVILLSLSPFYEMAEELLKTMNEGSEKTGIEYKFIHTSLENIQ